MNKRISEFRVDCHFGELAGIEYNALHEQQPSIIYIHGWLDNAASFQPIMDKIADLIPNAHQVAFDLAGHGLSSHKASDDFYSFHDYIDDLHQLLVNLSLKKCILVGHSLGGLITSCYSAAFPEHVVGLIQIDGIGPLGESAENAVHRLRQGIVSRERVRRKPRKGYASFEQALAHKAKTTKLNHDVVLPMVERGIEQRGNTWYWRADNRLSALALYRMSVEQVVTYLQHIHCRFDIVAAQHGLITQRNDLQRWRPSHAVVHHFPGGHHCHLENPTALAELIQSQWQQL